MSYKKIEDGQSVFFTIDQPALIACCDCGLVHEATFTPTPRGKYVEAKFTRKPRNTAQRRRHFSK